MSRDILQLVDVDGKRLAIYTVPTAGGVRVLLDVYKKNYTGIRSHATVRLCVELSVEQARQLRAVLDTEMPAAGDA